MLTPATIYYELSLSARAYAAQVVRCKAEQFLLEATEKALPHSIWRADQHTCDRDSRTQGGAICFCPKVLFLICS